MDNRKRYSKEFKLEVLEMVRISGKSHSQIEREMGLGNGAIYRWLKEHEEYREDAFPGNGNPKEKEIYELKRELERTKRQRDILKKALAIFSEESKQ